MTGVTQFEEAEELGVIMPAAAKLEKRLADSAGWGERAAAAASAAVVPLDELRALLEQAEQSGVPADKQAPLKMKLQLYEWWLKRASKAMLKVTAAPASTRPPLAGWCCCIFAAAAAAAAAAIAQSRKPDRDT